MVILYRRFGTTYRSHLPRSRCPETSVRDNHSTLLNIPEERRSRQHRDVSLKSRVKMVLYGLMLTAVHIGLEHRRFELDGGNANSEFLITVTMKVDVLWKVTPSILVVYGRFRGTCCLSLVSFFTRGLGLLPSFRTRCRVSSHPLTHAACCLYYPPVFRLCYVIPTISDSSWSYRIAECCYANGTQRGPG